MNFLASLFADSDPDVHIPLSLHGCQKFSCAASLHTVEELNTPVHECTTNALFLKKSTKRQKCPKIFE